MGFTSLTVLHAAATSYVVNRLLPYTKYEFVVIPFQRGSPGAASALVEAYTMAVSLEYLTMLLQSDAPRVLFCSRVLLHVFLKSLFAFHCLFGQQGKYNISLPGCGTSEKHTTKPFD